nr:cytochrome c biogenesis protein ResB [Nocardioides convexus]
MLLLLLALAAIPGSVIPQAGVDSLAVTRWKSDHPKAHPRLRESSTCSRSTPRPGSPRSTCCWCSRWWAASCPGCSSTTAPCAPGPRWRRGT